MTTQRLAAFDPAATLARVEGDKPLLAEMAELFLRDCPRILARMNEAWGHRDAVALERAVHCLRGSVGNFAAASAYEAATSMEKLAHAGDFVAAGKSYGALIGEIDLLKSLLATYLREVKS